MEIGDGENCTRNQFEKILTVNIRQQTIIDKAVKRIQDFEQFAMAINPSGYYVNFSGGKDSQVLLELVKMAGVNYTAHMALTSIDPPEVMKFVRENYPDVKLHEPKISMYELIKKKQALPLRNMRFCCQVLKETHGAGYVNMLGIRKSESHKRSKRNMIEVSNHKLSIDYDQFNIDREILPQCVNGKDKILFSPIIDWLDADIWTFIRSRGMKYCQLYDEKYTRVGCMFCPAASKRTKKYDLIKYPKVAERIKMSIQYIINKNNYGNSFIQDPEEIFKWWISNDSLWHYKGRKDQLKLDI